MKKRLKKALLILLLLPIILTIGALVTVYYKQDAVVQYFICKFNEDFEGEVRIKDSEIAPFANFPYISIALVETEIYEQSAPDTSQTKPILDLDKLYLGFNIWKIIEGDYEIKQIKLSNGRIHAVQYEDGGLNLANAFASRTAAVETDTTISEGLPKFTINLKAIKLSNVKVIFEEKSQALYTSNLFKDLSTKFTYDNGRLDLKLETVFTSLVTQNGPALKATADFSEFKTSLLFEKGIASLSLNSKFKATMLQNGDTSFLNRQNFTVATQLDFNTLSSLLSLKDLNLTTEYGDFSILGDIDVDDDLNLNLELKGAKPNFDIIKDVAPKEVASVLALYENNGAFIFTGLLKGKAGNGNIPSVRIDFDCKDLDVDNVKAKKQLKNLQFKGHFEMKEQGRLEDMELKIDTFSAQPDVGAFKGGIAIKNFKKPDVDFNVHADFNLPFLVKFFNLDSLDEIGGRVSLDLNFKDIIDLNKPEDILKRLDKSDNTRLRIDNLSFPIANYHLPVENMTMYAKMDGNAASVDSFYLKIGNSAFNFKGFISNLPAFFYRSDDSINSKLQIFAQKIDLAELTNFEWLDSNGIKQDATLDETINNLNIALNIKSTAKKLTEFKYLPEGEFTLSNFELRLKQYPNPIQDIQAKLKIDRDKLNLVQFKGMLGKNDFDLSVLVENYGLFMADSLKGRCKVTANYRSDTLKFNRLAIYKGYNYIPSDYQHEALTNANLALSTILDFEDTLKRAQVSIKALNGQLKLHPDKFQRFKGAIDYSVDRIKIRALQGELGKNAFKVDAAYYLGSNRDTAIAINQVNFSSRFLSIDRLMAFSLDAPTTSTPTVPTGGVDSTESTAESLDILALPFPNIRIQATIQEIKHGGNLYKNINTKMRIQDNHFVYIDALKMNAADGLIELKGNFDATNPKAIYFNPEFKVAKIDLSKLLVKFDNFGQEYVLSDNITGKLSGAIRGKVQIQRDGMPMLDNATLKMRVVLVNGEFINFAPIVAIQDYGIFGNKNLRRLRFNRMDNTFNYSNGLVEIPSMAIESSIGYMELSGKQDIVQDNMEYFFKIPLKLIGGVAMSKLFGGKKKIDPNKEDAIETKKGNKGPFLNVQVIGSTEDFDVNLKKAKKAPAEKRKKKERKKNYKKNK